MWARIHVFMNVTLSIDEELVRRAREYARVHETSLNKLIRDYLTMTVGDLPRDVAAEEFEVVARTMAGSSGGAAWSGRDELYAQRIDRIGRG